MEWPRVSDTARIVLDGKAVSGANALKVKLDAGSGEQRFPSELRVVLDQRASLEGQSSVSSAGGSQKKRKVVVRKRVGRHAGARVVPAERHGRGRGGVKFHSKCGEQFGWMV